MRVSRRMPLTKRSAALKAGLALTTCGSSLSIAATVGLLVVALILTILLYALFVSYVSVPSSVMDTRLCGLSDLKDSAGSGLKPPR